MNRSPIDELFNELFGYYPNKAGQAYELLAAAALSVITSAQVSSDQHRRGIYSETDYQIDAVLPSGNAEKMVEAKDYTTNNRKVGRGDLQKLQGALTDLEFEKGLFASATDYTKPARKYAEGARKNPHQKEIDLFHIRPSTESDVTGRLTTVVINMTIVAADYRSAQYHFVWTQEAEDELVRVGIMETSLVIRLDTFYTRDGEIDCTLAEHTYQNPPIHINIEDEYGLGCWVLANKYIDIDGKLYGLKGIGYKIPFTQSTTTLTIEANGEPRVLIKSEDGKVDKLVTTEELRKHFIGLTNDNKGSA